jgi:hypothetical protein
MLTQRASERATKSGRGLPRSKTLRESNGLRRSVFFGQFQGMANGAFRTAFQLVADRPMILPNQVFRMGCAWIDEHESSLEIVHQRLIRLGGKVGQQTSEQPNRLVGVSFSVEQNKRFAQFDMFGAVDIELAHDHEAAKDQQTEEQEKELVLAQKSHPVCLWSQQRWRSNRKPKHLKRSARNQLSD